MKVLRIALLLAACFLPAAAADAQATCKDCVLVAQGGTDPEWRCQVVEVGGFHNCQVGGTNCIMSSGCDPQFASITTVLPDGVVNRVVTARVTAYAILAAPTPSANGVFSFASASAIPVRRFAKECSGAVLTRAYAAEFGKQLRLQTKALVI